jgi:hypothetical protein
LKVSEIKYILNARLLCGQELIDFEIESACGADLMSDVLAFVKDNCVLLTGQTNPQVIKTAEMLDVSCIVFVRGKYPIDGVCELANEIGMVLLQTEETLYSACGLLFQKGLKPCKRRIIDG